MKALFLSILLMIGLANPAWAMRYASVRPTMSSATMNASLTSSAMRIEHIVGISCQASWSGGGSPVGNLKLQASNDGGTTWSDVPGSTATAAVSGNSGSVYIEKDGAHFRDVRVAYAFTSGTATLANPYCVLKGFGQ